MKKIFLIFLVAFTFLKSFSQNVGIGTTNPNPKAILDVKATDKGILFPRMTTVQRNAIANPPNGLHIFNTDDGCLNYYDSLIISWNCYCQSCATVVITIAANACNIDFYKVYAKNFLTKNFAIRILSGVTVSACAQGDTALSFTSMPANSNITIINYGTIIGSGGGGGGGAGGTVSGNNYGGGGGGGGGFADGLGGSGGGYPTCNGLHCGGFTNSLASMGYKGFGTFGGSGGAGYGSGGGTGGKGGNIGQAGASGTGVSPGTGGAAGKAIGGGAGNVLINIGPGESYGTVD